MNEHSRNEQELEGVTLLGNQNTKYSYEYNPDVLETFVNKHPENEYVVTFDAYEFTSLCLAGDTLIDVTRDESVHPDGIPIKDLVGTEGFVFGFDEKTQKVVSRKYTDVRRTGEQVPVVKIIMDKVYDSTRDYQHEQATLTCTPDHLILVQDEAEANNVKWVEAQNLQPGMRLIAGPRQSLELLALNHTVISVEPCGVADVYNMEVDDVHNFFANEVVVHNCPKTGQPDLAKVIINYIPRDRMVESKSLKLYLFSVRNFGSFHEDCMNTVLNDLVKLMDPKYLEVRGIFAPRGGIAIFPFVNYVAEDCPHLKDLYKQRQLDVLRDSANRTVRYDFG